MLLRDSEGRYVWNESNDSTCAWRNNMSNANELHGVIDVDAVSLAVGAAGEDALLVRLPDGGVDGDGDRLFGDGGEVQWCILKN